MISTRPALLLTVLVSLFAWPPPSAAASQAPVSQPVAAEEQEDFIDADRPGFADTSTVIGVGWIQVETGIQREFRGRGRDREHTLFIPTLFRVGTARNLELRVEGNGFATATLPNASPAQPRVSGLAPFSLGAEYQVTEIDGLRHPGVGVIGRLFPAWGTSAYKAGRVTGDARLAVNWDFAPGWTLNPNVGIGSYEGDDGRFTAALFALTLAYAPARRVGTFVDIGLQTPEIADGATGATFDAGIAVFPSHDVQLDFSAGTSIAGDTPPDPFIGFGISFRVRAFRR